MRGSDPPGGGDPGRRDPGRRESGGRESGGSQPGGRNTGQGEEGGAPVPPDSTAPRAPTAPTSEAGEIPKALRRFVELFNREAFWDSHEILEGPWREGRSEFYHGLILYASAFVHVQRDNPHGIAAQLRKAEAALTPLAPDYLGIDVDEVLRTCRRIRARVRAAPSSAGGDELGEPGDHGEPWTARLAFPRIELDPGRVRGDEPELEGGEGAG